jgi:hypothetical protein
VGTANFIEGEMANDGSAYRFVTPGLAPFGFVHARVDRPGRAVLAFRPHAVELGLDAREAFAGLALTGSVVDREFIGEYVRYRVRTPVATIVADRPHLAHAALFAPGQAVHVRVPASQVKVLP